MIHLILSGRFPPSKDIQGIPDLTFDRSNLGVDLLSAFSLLVLELQSAVTSERNGMTEQFIKSLKKQ